MNSTWSGTGHDRGERRPPAPQVGSLKLADFAPVGAELACTFHDPELWFSEDPDGVSQAKAICLTCPFLQECGDYALATRQLHGVWGALSEEDRMTLLRPPGRRTCPRCGEAVTGRSVYDTDECREAARADSRALFEASRKDHRSHNRRALASVEAAAGARDTTFARNDDLRRTVWAYLAANPGRTAHEIARCALRRTGPTPAVIQGNTLDLCRRMERDGLLTSEREYRSQQGREVSLWHAVPDAFPTAYAIEAAS